MRTVFAIASAVDQEAEFAGFADWVRALSATQGPFKADWSAGLLMGSWRKRCGGSVHVCGRDADGDGGARCAGSDGGGGGCSGDGGGGGGGVSCSASIGGGVAVGRRGGGGGGGCGGRDCDGGGGGGGLDDCNGDRVVRGCLLAEKLFYSTVMIAAAAAVALSIAAAPVVPIVVTETAAGRGGGEVRCRAGRARFGTEGLNKNTPFVGRCGQCLKLAMTASLL